MTHKRKDDKPRTKADGPKWDPFGNARTTVILDKESYYLIKAGSKRVFGRPDLTAFFRSSARANAINVLGKDYNQIVQDLINQEEAPAA